MSILGSKMHQLFPIISRATIIRKISNPNIIQRNFTVSNTFLKKSLENLDPESKVILLGNKDKKIEMKYSEVLEKVGERKLVKVQMTKKADLDLPMFKIMSDVDLEIAARKARTESNYLGSRTIYETDSGRLKQKQMELKSKLSDNDLSFQTAKILKWLQKGHFVNINIKVARGDTKDDAAALKKKIEDGMSEHKDMLGANNSKLVINIK
eukprot:TRINITY_DN16503_c0_g1_i1.p1 TRINITY_DN16503_c0_g1~~TRINITY_DN16503_c0_g1_i1.p1  ORF type:complete len:210 (-),score=62.92 TRINITY_DN16503_c0_g1_i1:54-683(-)